MSQSMDGRATFGAALPPPLDGATAKTCSALCSQPVCVVVFVVVVVLLLCCCCVVVVVLLCCCCVSCVSLLLVA